MKINRMMIYCWSEPAYPGRYKVGEHWVNDMTFDEAVADTIAGRIRSSLGVRKDIFDRKEVVVHFVMDASAYAVKKNKFKPRAKLDSELHQLIENRYGLGEVFECEYQKIVDVVEKEVGPIDPTIVTTTITSKRFKQLINSMKDRENCVLDQGDPKHIWQRIIDSLVIPSYNKKKPSILIPACGYGTEIDVLAEKLEMLGWTDADIKKSITVNDRSDQFTDPRKKEGYRAIVGDFFYLDFNMNFDLTIGNPPYNKGMLADLTLSNSYKNVKGYPHLFFMLKSLRLTNPDGIVSFVMPSGFMSLPSLKGFREELLNNYSVDRIDILYNRDKRHFNIGLSQIAVLTVSNKRYEGVTIITREKTSSEIGELTADLRQYPEYWPLFYNEIYKSIFDKVQNKRTGNIEWAKSAEVLSDTNYISFPIRYNDFSENHLLGHIKDTWLAGSTSPTVNTFARLKFNSLEHRDLMFNFYRSDLFTMLLCSTISTNKIQDCFPTYIGDFIFDGSSPEVFFELSPNEVDYIKAFYDN